MRTIAADWPLPRRPDGKSGSWLSNMGTGLQRVAGSAWAARRRATSEGQVSRDAFVQAREKVTGKKDEKSSLTQWTWIQKNQPYAKDLVLTDEQINFVQRVNMDFKVQKAVLPISQVADMSLARDALKLLKS